MALQNCIIQLLDVHNFLKVGWTDELGVHSSYNDDAFGFCNLFLKLSILQTALVATEQF